MYFGEMLPLFTEIKNTAQSILELNQNNMVQADRDARELSALSTRYMVIAILIGLVLALYFASRLQRSILRPIQALTSFARELGEGNLDQVVPVLSEDELGSLADAFNKMATKLRAYRQITSDEILQARQMTEITFSAFPDPIICALDARGGINFKNPAAEKLLHEADSGRPASRTAYGASRGRAQGRGGLYPGQLCQRHLRAPGRQGDVLPAPRHRHPR